MGHPEAVVRNQSRHPSFHCHLAPIDHLRARPCCGKRKLAVQATENRVHEDECARRQGYDVRAIPDLARELCGAAKIVEVRRRGSRPERTHILEAEGDEGSEELRRPRRVVPGGRVRGDELEWPAARIRWRGVLPDDTVSPTEHRGLPRPRLPVRCSVWLPHCAREPGETRRAPYPHLCDARTRCLGY